MSHSGDRFTDIELENKRLPACCGYITWKLLSLRDAMKELQGFLQEINYFVKEAKKHCSYPNDDNLTKDESAAIYIYTMEISDDSCVYRILNETLRLEDRTKVRPWFGYLKLLHSATSKLPTLKGTIWRGINKDVTMHFKKGQKITWWSISSCSTSLDVISSFLNKSSPSTLFNIECLNGKSISSYTCYPNDKEVILMPGTVFEVVSNPSNRRHEPNTIYLKEVSDDDDDDDDEPPRSSTSSPPPIPPRQPRPTTAPPIPPRQTRPTTAPPIPPRQPRPTTAPPIPPRQPRSSTAPPIPPRQPRSSAPPRHGKIIYRTI
ncbi:unnamed protein product [Adineta steineri]|uniref:NAD(P)(+)--arginine ADP-ribosyltransferase n=1 Tax=Adineta steineri TaxID=433720 RepID=A0A814W8W7_9BILA|nr:unnamed protein product [Adineta steineri]